MIQDGFSVINEASRIYGKPRIMENGGSIVEHWTKVWIMVSLLQNMV